MNFKLRSLQDFKNENHYNIEMYVNLLKEEGFVIKINQDKEEFFKFPYVINIKDLLELNRITSVINNILMTEDSITIFDDFLLS